MDWVWLRLEEANGFIARRLYPFLATNLFVAFGSVCVYRYQNGLLQVIHNRDIHVGADESLDDAWNRVFKELNC